MTITEKFLNMLTWGFAALTFLALVGLFLALGTVFMELAAGLFVLCIGGHVLSAFALITYAVEQRGGF